MPKAAISDHLRRVWRLLDILPAPGEGKTKVQLNEELSHEFDVTLKTTERDLQFLLEEGFAVTVPGKSYDGLKSKMVWQQAPDKNLTMVRMMRTDNALAFHLIDQLAEKSTVSKCLDIYTVGLEKEEKSRLLPLKFRLK